MTAERRAGSPASLRVFIVGPGRLGCSLGRALAGIDGVELVGVAFHSEAGRARAARWLPEVSASPIGAIREIEAIDVVLLTVRDDVIGAAAAAVAPRLEPHHVALHTSGLRGIEAFEGADLPCDGGSFHPLQSFADPETGPGLFAGAFIACEGDVRAVEVGRDLATRLGARVVVLESAHKAAYHAAAVVAANYLTAVTEMAARLCAIAGIEVSQAIEMLAPLQQGALDNLQAVGLPAALTGPIARGDVDTVRAHLGVLETHLPALRPVYAALGKVAVEIAAGQGQDRARLDEILRALQRKE